MDSIEMLKKAIQIINAEYENNLRQFADTGILTESVITLQTIIEYNMRSLEDTLEIFLKEMSSEEWEDEMLPDLQAAFEEELNLANAILGLPSVNYHELSSCDCGEYHYTEEDEESNYSDWDDTPMPETFFYEIKDYTTDEEKPTVNNIAGMIDFSAFPKINIKDESHNDSIASHSEQVSVFLESLKEPRGNGKIKNSKEKLDKIRKTLSIVPLEVYRNKDYREGWEQLKEQILNVIDEEEKS